MKLCVFQGTFNPIHNVHLQMANYVKKVYDYDCILFIPAYKPPHKEVDDELSNHRLQMVKLAIEGENFFHLSNIEFQNERYSYTYLTIVELYKRYKIEGKIGFIIGTDAFREIESWYESKKLKDLVEFIVFERENDFQKEKLNNLKSKGYNYTMAHMEFVDLSSSMLRDRLENGHLTSTLVPPKVLEYINKHGLYRKK